VLVLGGDDMAARAVVTATASVAVMHAIRAGRAVVIAAHLDRLPCERGAEVIAVYYPDLAP